MNITNTGQLIRRLRTELGLTQSQLAEKLYISDKTVSKWERGQGLPDISIINELATIFNVSIETILSGEINEEKTKMKKRRFYRCSECGNVIHSMGEVEAICCGKKMSFLEEQTPDEEHKLNIQMNDGGYYVTMDHSMSKDHFISFIAIRKGVSIQMIETFPEWDLNYRDSNLKYSKIYYYCTKHGLFSELIRK